MTWREPSDGGILDALECDLAQWHAAAAQRDITDLRRISDRIAQRRAEVDHYLRDEIKYMKADADLARVERALVPRHGQQAPVYAPTRPVVLPWDDETHLQRWGLTYLGGAAAVVVTVLVVWLVVELVAALVAALAALIPVLVVAAVAVLLLGMLGGGGGGRGFSGTFSGRMH